MEMEEKITWRMLEEIYECYNPLGVKYCFLVDEFLNWSKEMGDFWWIWDGAVEWSKGTTDPKEIIKEIPFMKINDIYRELLRDSWIAFLNNNPEIRRKLKMEYECLFPPF